ncbi:MAG: DUF368 domain-containing protein [Lachnospiraceae bacterium]|nr:DUF368 domain-containing protein [Lachnospiraceae bacterium]
MESEGFNNQTEKTPDKSPKKRERTKLEKVIIDLVCGVAVGAGAILPGFSGGVLCVVLGMYPLIMELFSHPFKAAKKHWRVYIFIGIGWALGFFAVSNLIKFVYARYEVFTLWTFVGMIFGNVPSLFKEAGKKGRTKSSFISMAVAFVVMFAILFSVAMMPNLNITPNVWWYLFSGFMWGLSIIIPGLTSSSIMMSLGIYESFNAGLAGFKPIVIIPWVVGMLLTAAALARLVEYIFKKHYSEAFHAVIGIVVSSTIMIFPIFRPYALSDIFISAACVIVGFIAAYFLSNFKIEEQTD